MYDSDNRLYDESAISCLEVLNKPIHKFNEDCPYYATQYQDIFVQFHEIFLNFVTGKASQELKHVQQIIANKSAFPTLFTKAEICNGYVIPQESTVNPKYTNFLESKIGLVLYTLIYRSTRETQ